MTIYFSILNSQPTYIDFSEINSTKPLIWKSESEQLSYDFSNGFEKLLNSRVIYCKLSVHAT